MILEIAEFDIVPGAEGEFEAGVQEALQLFRRAKGYRGISLHRVIETPGTYRLLVQWETLEDHTVAFRNSQDFQVWRELVASCFASAPRVIHCEKVVEAG